MRSSSKHSWGGSGSELLPVGGDGSEWKAPQVQREDSAHLHFRSIRLKLLLPFNRHLMVQVKIIPVKIARLAIALGFLFFFPERALTQDTDGETAVAVDFEDQGMGQEVVFSSLEDVRISPLVFPFYSPTMEGALGGGALITFRTDSDEEMPRSTVQLTGMYSTIGAVGLGMRAHTFWRGDTIRANGYLGYTDTFSNYAGVGFDKGLSVGRGPATTLYDDEMIRFKPDLTFRVKGDWFVGFNFDWNHQDTDNPAPAMAGDPDFLRTGPNYFDSGLGLTVSHDTRDVTVAAREGHLFLFQTTHYRDWFGSDFEYDSIDFDFRRYFPLFRDGSTLAVMVQSRYTSGDVPWDSFTSLGTSRDLRGYHYGQFRDRTGVWAVAEYRHQFSKRDSAELSRHGMVTWAGIGFIGKDYSDLWSNDLGNVGIGYRFEIQERRNLRLDFGFGRNGESGLYLGFNESF